MQMTVKNSKQFTIKSKPVMKIYVSLVIILMLCACTAGAQYVNIGIKGGLNLYNIKNSNGAKYDTKAGLNAGLIGHIHLDRQFAIQPEVVYSSQGAKYTTVGIETKLNLGYINVPVLIQYMFDNGFRIEAGPQVGFLISAKSETNNINIDVKNNLQSVDFGLGAGLSYVNPSTGFSIDGRYNLGLSNINESSSVKSTNKGFQLGIFYLFKHH
jgi:hypothetical protein